MIYIMDIMDNSICVRILGFEGRSTQNSNNTTYFGWSYEANAIYTKEIRSELVEIQHTCLLSRFGKYSNFTNSSPNWMGKLALEYYDLVVFIGAKGSWFGKAEVPRKYEYIGVELMFIDCTSIFCSFCSSFYFPQSFCHAMRILIFRGVIF